MPSFYSKQNASSKKAKTSKTTSCSGQGGLNLNEEANGYGEEVWEVRSIGRDRAKKKTSSSSHSEASSAAGGGIVDIVAGKWKSLKSMLERLAGHEYYCFIDGFSGYFQIPISLEDQEKTTFTCPYRTFTYKRMPFGLCNAPATFQHCMTAIFHELIEDSMEVFMEDFSVFGNSFDHSLKDL
ncbi:RNA-directed DNA polymerase [Tanacetum coccineum]